MKALQWPLWTLLVIGLATQALADNTFPVSIEHKFGELHLQQAPERVVSVGFSDQDDLLALGVTPVAVRDWYGDMPYATWPWAQNELGDAQPVVLSRDGIDFEAIADLNPDLIVGISSGMTAEEYQKLSLIAPTLAQSGDYIEYGMPWQERTRVIGRALGKSEHSEQLISDIKARIEQLRSRHPEFQGATAAVAYYWGDQLGVYSGNDLRSRLLTDLGFEIPAVFDEIAGDSFYANLSQERLDLLDVDVLVWLSADDALKDAESLKLRPSLSVHQQNREVFAGKMLGGAFSFLSPLSLHYLLDELVPQLADAAGRIEKTEP